MTPAATRFEHSSDAECDLGPAIAAQQIHAPPFKVYFELAEQLGIAEPKFLCELLVDVEPVRAGEREQGEKPDLLLVVVQ